jgi:hypothetical protein
MQAASVARGHPKARPDFQDFAPRFIADAYCGVLILNFVSAGRYQPFPFDDLLRRLVGCPALAIGGE